MLTLTLAPAAMAHPDDGSDADDGGEDGQIQVETQVETQEETLERPNSSDELIDQDVESAAITSSGPNGKKAAKNLDLRGRGVRNVPDATTDVWAYEDYAYTGTFNSPCGGDPEAGVWVWDVKKDKKPALAGIIASPTGSRANDVKVAGMNSGDILVHSNESCGGGPGGFEIYDVDDPENPVSLASVRIDELNDTSSAIFGGITDVGVHNLWLFTQDDKDYVGVVAETAFDNFQIYDITDPTSPTLVSAWGAEEIFDPGVGDSSDFNRVLDAALWLLDGVGQSRNRFLHDITINEAATRAYLSNWDAGLVLLDISDPANPVFVSAAIDVANGSLDGELNSHSAWPNADGSVVVEGEEDFSAWENVAPPSNLTLDSPDVPGDATIPATAISTGAGDAFEANQTGNTGTVTGSSVSVTTGPLAGSEFAASELSTAAGSPTFATTGPLTGELVFIGRGCIGDPVLNAAEIDSGDIAVVRRGGCFFEDKANTAASLGAAGMVLANNSTLSTPWSGLRIWDYSDPANPVLASTFNTTCSAASTPIEGCAANGTYSAHNVVVDGDRAYISWYWDGLLVLDISDPYNPVEVARYTHDGSTQDGLQQDVWGVYKEPGSKQIYASDRNGGLYILKAKGDAVAKKVKADKAEKEKKEKGKG